MWVLQALLSHWWRHPVQLMTLMIGLMAATALWSGVQALNQQARLSYDQAAARFDSINQTQIISRTSDPISQDDYIHLRRMGWSITPLVEGELWVDEKRFSLVGIEPITLQLNSNSVSSGQGLPSQFSLTDFISPPWQIWLSANRAKQFPSEETEAFKRFFLTNSLETLPSLHFSDDIADDELIMDIGLAQQMLAMEGLISRLLVLSDNHPTTLPSPLSDRLRLVIPQSDYDISRLTESFHLNLTALSFLAYLVGLLMVYSAIHLALNQRLPLRRIILSCGVSQRALIGWLLIELLFISGMIALPGLLLGYWIAALLLPDLSASLAGLYGAQVSNQLQLSWRWWQQGLMMAWGGTLLAAAAPLLRLIKQDSIQLSGLAHPNLPHYGRFAWLGAVFCVAAILTALFGNSLLSGFILLGLIFINAALWLPFVLDLCLKTGQRIARSVTQLWLWSDARFQVPHLSVALVALLLALSTSIGVGGMVEGFRQTFTGWLDQRLAAEVYLRTEEASQSAQIIEWLNEQPQVTAILPSARATTSSQDMVSGLRNLDLRGIQVHETYVEHWPLLHALADAWQALDTTYAIMINEQLARQWQLRLGDRLQLTDQRSENTGAPIDFNIVAIYSDYGNPKGQVMMSLETLYQFWPDAEQGSFALRVQPEFVDSLVNQLKETFALGDTQVLDQQAVRDFSIRLFERTFAATHALNLLVLGIAAIALFSSLLTLSNMRLTQIAPVWACGVERKQLVLIELSRLLWLALITALLAIPLGLLVSYCLVAVINVRAFGWALPWQVFPLQWLSLTAAALVSALLASAIPLGKLLLSSPSELLKGFRDDQ